LDDVKLIQTQNLTFEKFQQSGKKSAKLVKELISDLDLRFDAIETYQDLLTKRAHPSDYSNYHNIINKLNLKKLKSDTTTSNYCYIGKENVYES